MLNEEPSSRRGFVASAVGMGISSVASAAPETILPTVKFGKVQVTRLIIGSNPLYGYAHFNSIFGRVMKEWMTPEQRMKVLKRCEEVGINTWQAHFERQSFDDMKRYRDQGGKMHWLVLGHGEMMKDLSLIKEVAKYNPIGIAHHGNLTDDRFRAGEMDKVRDFYHRVQDAGIPGGISTHNPAVVDYVEQHGWDNDYYMTCLYRVSRTQEESRREFGEAPMGETYFEKDPERMCKMIRLTKKTCFAFKLLAAGRGIDPADRVEKTFRYVFSNIKPQDAAIVGMWPRFKDEPKENADAVRRTLA